MKRDVPSLSTVRGGGRSSVGCWVSALGPWWSPLWWRSRCSVFSWVPPVELPVVGDLVPSQDAGTQKRATWTEGSGRSFDGDVSSTMDDNDPGPASTLPVASIPAATQLGDVTSPDDADSLIPTATTMPDNAGPRPPTVSVPNGEVEPATTTTLDPVAPPPSRPAATGPDEPTQSVTQSGRSENPGAPASTAPRSPPTSLPSQPSATTPVVSNSGGKAPDQPPGRTEAPSATAPGRP